MAENKIVKERKSTNLTQKELIILRKKTNLSEKEINLWYKQFLQNFPTGKADEKTFIESFKKMFPTIEINDISEGFDDVDENGDGIIDFQEYLIAIAVNASDTSLDERIEDVFDLWDVSHDGYIDQNELAHLISAMYDAKKIKDRQGENNPMTRAKAIIDKFDINSDRNLTKEEFLKGCKNDEIIATFLAPNE